jgi:elongator complex protein 3
MEKIILELLKRLSSGEKLDSDSLEKTLHKYNSGLSDNKAHYAKKKLLPYYLRIKAHNFETWKTWNVTPELENQLIKLLRVKPRRTASGVATITVLTKPWQCEGDCLYCPSDLRMPKSYLHNEPACQRAERNFFDPYLQVVSRLRALTQMGHATDKVELIVLGGTWSDYPREYQIWFISELFRALNESDVLAGETSNTDGTANGLDAVRSHVGKLSATNLSESEAKMRRTFYKGQGLGDEKGELAAKTNNVQLSVNNNIISYNKAIRDIYDYSNTLQYINRKQSQDIDSLILQQHNNELAQHRVVGLAIETRPDCITADNLVFLRILGCTKIQIGIQSLSQKILESNTRHTSVDDIQNAFALLRAFGFKIHIHFMLNLYGSTTEDDKRDYERLVTNKAYLPDEVKLYPCALVGGTGLCVPYENGTWRPYTEDELMDVLSYDLLATPAYTRISRMVRDISASDIVVGNKKANLRQMVENNVLNANGDNQERRIREIRYREINKDAIDIDDLTLDTVEYETGMSREYFLQWITAEDKIAGFLRLSLPNAAYVADVNKQLAEGRGGNSLAGMDIKPSLFAPNEAMIREVHVYGRVSRLHKQGGNAQHLGLGRRLIDKAITIAREHSYGKINVISSVGTREYYRRLGFQDNGLYQQKSTAL